MKSTVTFVGATFVLLAGLVVWQGSAAPAVAGDAPAVTAATIGVVVTPALGDEAEYVGDSKCKKCHMKQHKSWQKSKKAEALETLKPGNAAEIKTKHGLDPNKDYSTDEKCVKCHVTGFGAPGGYAFYDASDEKAAKEMGKLANVGCEMCHGPGSKYIEVHEEIQKSKRTYTHEEMYAAGLTKIDESTCTKCHNSEGPTFTSFDFAAMKEKPEGVHEHFELKQLTQ